MPQGHYGFPNILQLVRTTSLKVLGKPGATAGAGLAGGTTSGAPTSGQFDAGDAVVAQNGHLWICTASGSPGTWVDAGASAYTDPLTTRGDLVRRGAASTERLALGASGYVLTSDGTDAAWAAAGAGFADPMTTRGDLIVRGGGGTTRLALGSSGQYLKSDGTDAAWAAGGGALVQLAETILGSDTATITFSSISGAYRDLLLHLTGRGTTAAYNVQVLLQFNSDTGNTYDWSTSVFRGTSTTGGTTAGTTSSLRVGALSAASSATSVASSLRIRIADYARTQWFKAVHAEGAEHQDTGVNNAFFDLAAGQWRSTAAITSITLSCSAGSFKTGVVATLWGVS